MTILRKIFIITIILILVGSNVFLFLKLKEQPFYITFPNANSRETYFTLHHVKEAQQISQGKGIAVGILDHYFGSNLHPTLNKEAVYFLNNPESLGNISEHGYWMTCVLKEIAPACDVYALNTLDYQNEDK